MGCHEMKKCGPSRYEYRFTRIYRQVGAKSCWRIDRWDVAKEFQTLAEAAIFIDKQLQEFASSERKRERPSMCASELKYFKFSRKGHGLVIAYNSVAKQVMYLAKDGAVVLHPYDDARFEESLKVGRAVPYGQVDNAMRAAVSVVWNLRGKPKRKRLSSQTRFFNLEVER